MRACKDVADFYFNVEIRKAWFSALLPSPRRKKGQSPGGARG